MPFLVYFSVIFCIVGLGISGCSQQLNPKIFDAIQNMNMNENIKIFEENTNYQLLDFECSELKNINFKMLLPLFILGSNIFLL